MVPASSWLVARIKFQLHRRVSVASSGLVPNFLRRPGTYVPGLLYAAPAGLGARPRLRGPSWPHRQIPHLGEDARHLHSVQLRHEGQDFRDKLIFHQFADFVLTVLFAATEQFRHGHLQGSRQPFQGRQRWRGFLVLTLGNVGPRHGHASGKLPLAQPAAQAQRADGRCQIQMPAAVAGHGHHYRGCKHHWLRLGFLVQGRVAAPAIVIDRTELNQQAMIATDDFPRIYWGKSRGHRFVGVPERATP